MYQLLIDLDMDTVRAVLSVRVLTVFKNHFFLMRLLIESFPIVYSVKSRTFFGSAALNTTKGC